MVGGWCTNSALTYEVVNRVEWQGFLRQQKVRNERGTCRRHVCLRRWNVAEYICNIPDRLYSLSADHLETDA